MAEARVERRLAAILAADVAGYSRLMALTRKAQIKVVPGEVTEYNIEILATANLFRRGHRICLEIASADMPTGVAGATNAEYVANHICSSKTTMHKLYHDGRRPSHLLLPVIPQ